MTHAINDTHHQWQTPSMTHTIYPLLREWSTLFWVHFKVKFINLIEYGQVVIHYYPNVNFAKIDSALLLSYLFLNPYHISSRFLSQKGEEELFTYGETPLTTLERIAHNSGITSQDVVFELGCGRGRTCFWLNQFIGCSVVGVDFVPTFIEKGNKIKKRFQVKGVSFRLEDFLQPKLCETNLNVNLNFFQGATVIYLYGSCLSAKEIRHLISLFTTLPEGTTVITVSYPLTDYQSKAPFTITKQFPALFTWGEAEVFVQKKI